MKNNRILRKHYMSPEQIEELCGPQPPRWGPLVGMLLVIACAATFGGIGLWLLTRS